MEPYINSIALPQSVSEKEAGHFDLKHLMETYILKNNLNPYNYEKNENYRPGIT
jgi:hypothetical protein